MAAEKNKDLEIADKLYEGIQKYVKKMKAIDTGLSILDADPVSEAYSDYDAETFSALKGSGVTLSDSETMSELEQYGDNAKNKENLLKEK